MEIINERSGPATIAVSYVEGGAVVEYTHKFWLRSENCQIDGRPYVRLVCLETGGQLAVHEKTPVVQLRACVEVNDA